MRGKSITINPNITRKRRFSNDDGTEKTTNLTKKRKISNDDDTKQTMSLSKEPRTYALYRTTSTDLSIAKQRWLGLTPYLCEKLPAKHVVSYAPLSVRVELADLAKFITKLSQPDVKVIEWAMREGKHWEAHKSGLVRRLTKPINAEQYGYQNFKYLESDHPIIVQLLKDDRHARLCNDKYQITWVMLSIKPSLEQELAGCNKGWEMRLAITSVLKEGPKAIQFAIDNPNVRAKQDLSQKSTKKSVEKGKGVLKYILKLIDELQAYVVHKANESNRPYYPRRDSLIVFVGDHLLQFNITLDQVFSAIPLKISSKKFKAGKFGAIKPYSLDELITKYTPGEAEAMS